MSEFNIRCILSSGDGEENKGCTLNLALWKWSVYLKLPALIKPLRKQIVAKSWDAATVARLGRDWYWNYTELVYGFYLFGNHFNILYGRRTDDSSTEQRWSCFLPFAEWRFHRHSLYDLDGRCQWTQIGRRRKPGAKGAFDELREAEKSLPKAVFSFLDYDGQLLTATTFIEEREWRFGDGWFKWLSWFVPSKKRRNLNIWFSGETGPKKGSWKGGTLGHGIDMLAGDSPEWAFRRYCAAHNMTFLGRVESSKQRMHAS